ncbi:MAG: hypothetical protein GY862_03795 [Gammaproteobacteria bacterium]|nr:hypothetical protein [Gammaproteobacteria bacterium]
MEEIISDPPSVSEADVEQAKYLMQTALREGECTLHDLLEQVAGEHNALPLSKVLAALAHGQYALAGDEKAWLMAGKTGTRFESAHCSGDDILLQPLPEKEAIRA